MCNYSLRLATVLIMSALFCPLLSFQGTAADRFFHSLSSFIQGMDTKNIVKVSERRNAQMHQLHNSKCGKCCVKKGQEIGKDE